MLPITGFQRRRRWLQNSVVAFVISATVGRDLTDLSGIKRKQGHVKHLLARPELPEYRIRNWRRCRAASGTGSAPWLQAGMARADGIARDGVLSRGSPKRRPERNIETGRDASG